MSKHFCFKSLSVLLSAAQLSSSPLSFPDSISVQQIFHIFMFHTNSCEAIGFCNMAPPSTASMKIYRCVFENCTKSFPKPSLLQSHIYVHTGVRPFPCSLCSKAYFKSSHLNVHIKSHYPKEFHCAHCERSFATKDKLVRHGDCQVEYICYICDKIYQKRRCLDRHLERHKRRAKTHKCGVCKGIYASGKSLKQHSRLHVLKDQVLDDPRSSQCQSYL